ncbi:site-2 protease family protein [Oculatella sp. LEGE 06141]|uniref:site-2 protease family protein n=1 Tax=Oculatella sp. LEGE 06141 TaxID=1828648 RepID=UPI00188287FD|nr:site-2 protease family protein [Oculatella sp. LEGE 06141]MBE9182555.1 site-2 protease family protein [Oculatella sp. LEGE 06141]
MITGLILLIALGILGWGFYRARPFGKLGILAWLQSVVLMAPWLLFFGLFAVGVYLNLAGILLLIVLSSGLYIYLGKRLRAEGANFAAKRFSPVSDAAPSGNDATPAEAGQDAEATAQAPVDPVEPAKPDELSIPAEDMQAIKGVFGIDTFFATETIPYQNGAIFKGNLRGEPEESHARLSASLKERLDDRYRLYLVEGPDNRPVVVVLPSTADPKPTTVTQAILAVVLAIATIVTTMETAGILQGFDFFSNLDRYPDTLLTSGGILLVLAAHEIGHRVLAGRYNVRLSPPFFIPTWQIGAFGALTRFESVLPNRNVLFDIAFAGPAIGGLVSLGMLMAGLLLSHPGSYFQLPSEFFQGSILVGTLARVVLGSALQQSIVDINPLMVIGWLGLVITAINLLPAGQLDGGRIVLAIYGRKVAGRATVATLIFLGLAALVNPLALYWAIVILFLQRDLERPALNELSEPDDARAALGLLALFLMIATLLPLTPSLAGRLGIGG